MRSRRSGWWQASVGSGLRVGGYRTHVINASEIPPLMSLPCLKGNKAWIDCHGDRLFLPHPLYAGGYVVLHLKFTGAHFVLPVDQVEESYEYDKVEELGYVHTARFARTVTALGAAYAVVDVALDWVVLYRRLCLAVISGSL